VKIKLLILFFFGAVPYGLSYSQPRINRDRPEQVWNDPSKPLDLRVQNLISSLTLQAKISQLLNTSVAVDRLGITAYNWWSEALHGIARSGLATVFPQPSWRSCKTWTCERSHHRYCFVCFVTNTL